MLKKSLLVVVCILATMLALVTCGKKNPQGSSTPAAVTLVSISVEGQQTEFRYEEKFKFGGSVVANYSNGTKKTLEFGYKIDSSAFNSAQAGEYTIVVTYEDKQVSYQVVVNNAAVAQIELSGLKTQYAWNEEFVFEGVVAERYTSGGTSVIDETKYVVDYDEYDSQVPGTYTITVYYASDESIYQTYTVTVGAIPVLDIEVVTYKQNYSVLEEFDIADVEGFYELENGSKVEISAENTTVELVNYKDFTIGTYSVILTNKENADITTTLTVNSVKAETVRILFIGNSFSDDTSEYLPTILANLGYSTVEVGNMFIGGCTIDTHYSNIRNQTNAYDFRFHNGNFWNRSVGGAKKSIQFAVEYRDWDVISVQQASGSSGMPNTYNNLYNLVNEIKKLSDAKIVFNMTWAYQQGCTHAEYPNYNNNQQTMYNAIINTVQTRVKYPVMPCGTAIQNARTSFIGDNLTLDGYHLNEYIGRYIASLTVVATLLDDNLANLTWMPERVTTAQKAVAVESALNAARTPFAVTNSQYLTA